MVDTEEPRTVTQICLRCGLMRRVDASPCLCGHDGLLGGTQALTENRGLRRASLRDRLAGRFIDSLVGHGGLLVSAYLTRGLGLAAGAAILPFLAYSLLADGMGTGQSVGKMLMNTAVVDEKTGLPCSYGKSVVRNLLRLLSIFDWIFILGGKRRRLGDMAAGTIVIKRPQSERYLARISAQAGRRDVPPSDDW
jgi:uncharacterized RDD family membrane protein YckC